MFLANKRTLETTASKVYLPGIKRGLPMCRNIKTLHNFKPPATEDEIRASSEGTDPRRVQRASNPSASVAAIVAVQTFFDHYRISFTGLPAVPRCRCRPFAAFDLANRRSVAIPKSAQFSLTACSNELQFRVSREQGLSDLFIPMLGIRRVIQARRWGGEPNKSLGPGGLVREAGRRAAR